MNPEKTELMAGVLKIRFVWALVCYISEQIVATQPLIPRDPVSQTQNVNKHTFTYTQERACVRAHEDREKEFMVSSYSREES